MSTASTEATTPASAISTTPKPPAPARPLGDATPDAAHALDPMTLPLWGSRLIEASAGTGKTWTIAALYLRLVLGHDTASGRPLAPAEILVMTFTVAATRELSSRIRSRLIEAAACFRGEAEPGDGDDFLRSLLAAYEPGTARSRAAWRLAVAAESMDDAAVLTIDAWCQRMLLEHALGSGNLFDEELIVDDRHMMEEAARDYWRQKIYPLTGPALDAALTIWPGVSRLIDDVAKLRWHARPEHGQAPDIETLLARTEADHADRLREMKLGWDTRAEQMREWIHAQVAHPRCPFNKRKLAKAKVNGWLDGLRAWALDPGLHKPHMKSGLERFTPKGMHDIRDGDATLELPEHFEHFGRLVHALEELPSMERTLRLHAAACVVARLDELKRQAGIYGFQDLLDRLANALQGAGGEHLRESIVRQYPVALVDEFQDTSPAQYAIFDSLYGVSRNDPDTALLLIGDPKQSIYSFRGADIRSYLRAKRSTEGRHYKLGTNFRSTHDVVMAVNRLFGRAEARNGPGAFGFRRGADGAGAAGGAGGGAPAFDPLPFDSVDANGIGDMLVDESGRVPALRLVYDIEISTRDVVRQRFAARCAEDIAQLLNDPLAGFEDARGGDALGLSRVKPGDIAVLVRDRNEAAAVRGELRARGVASVYLSDQESVFFSAEARDLLRWLEAVLSPLDTRLVRAALATGTIGLDLAELARLASDEEAFEVRAEQLRVLNGVWLRQGVLTMLRQTLHLFGLPARWLAEVGGERKLTNFLHLAELVQAAAGRLDGEQALIHWLRDQMEGDAAAGDERIVRLESDADLVQVVTVHKSKGLEYSIVYAPFVWGHRSVTRKGRTFVAVPREDDAGHDLSFGLTEAVLAVQRREQLQEDLRLLYVALTRARHAIWLGVGIVGTSASPPVSQLHLSGFGALLSGGEDVIDAGALGELLHHEYGDCPAISLIDTSALEPGRSQLLSREEEQPLADAQPYRAAFERNWGVGSFSALVRNIEHSAPGQVMSELAREEELLSAPLEEAAPAASVAPWHRFPRGALPGNFLHDQLEWLASEGFALAASQELRGQLARRCERQGWGHRSADVVQWLTALSDTPLGAVGIALNALDTRLPEMEFWFPSENLDASAIDRLCRVHLLGGRPRPSLPPRRLNGMLMGFADLVFQHEGRYWVLDYKSNALGDRDGDYHRDAMEAAMAEHRYDLQAALYLLALHRLLRQRLGDDYRPDTHLGGAVYLFLRGLNGPERGSYVVPADVAMLDALDHIVGSGGEIADAAETSIGEAP